MGKASVERSSGQAAPEVQFEFKSARVQYGSIVLSFSGLDDGKTHIIAAVSEAGLRDLISLRIVGETMTVDRRNSGNELSLAYQGGTVTISAAFSGDLFGCHYTIG